MGEKKNFTKKNYSIRFNVIKIINEETLLAYYVAKLYLLGKKSTNLNLRISASLNDINYIISKQKFCNTHKANSLQFP